jgi:ribosomal protein S12 methylthiotransferase
MSGKPEHPRVALVSLGCPKNLVDSEKMMALLAEGGCTVGAPMDEADVIVVNTCGFLSAAREESLGVVREALAHKAAGRARRVVVAGCLVNRDAGKLFDLAPGIDAIVGVNDRDDLLKAVKESKGEERRAKGEKQRSKGERLGRFSDPGNGGQTERKIQLSKDASIVSDAGRFRLTPRHTAYLRISEGCSQKCTFCTIPSIRGPFRSKPPRDVLAEARELIADGALELNVIGQDTTSYGMDLGTHGRPPVGFGGNNGNPGKNSLADLMKSLSQLEGVRWVRLMYAYPNRFNDALIDAMASCEKIVPYVDLPLQHISDGVLRRMGRRVTRAKTETLLDKLRRRVPGIAIRTTFIVAFPGETQAQFAELLKFVKEFRFDALGVFEFSPEEGTPAARLDRRVAPEIAAQRARAVMLAQQKIAFAANRRRVGQTIEVLVDGTDSQGRCVGRHAGQAPDIDSVCILKKKSPPGKFVRMKVVGADGYDLMAD